MSVPSSGRPIWLTTSITSGYEAMMARASREISACRVETDVQRGRVANPEVALFQLGHELPPEQGSRQAVETIRAAKNATVSQRCARQRPQLLEVARLM